MKAIILNVGNEVLSGKTINTNASFISIGLEKIGVEVIEVITIGDNSEMLKKEVKNFQDSSADILITTGGLGPTHDDFTKEVLFDTLNIPLVERKEAIDLLDKYFKSDYAKCNLKQALYPKEAYLLPNEKGTAMGAVIEYENKTYSLLVGPPFEMNPMFNDYLIPYLKKKCNVKKTVKEYIVMGTGESQIEEILTPLYQKYPDIEIAPYASLGKIRYQLTNSNNSNFDEATKEFEEVLKEYIISDKNEEIEEKVYQELLRLNYHISFSESCTGGLLASKMVNVNGASSVFSESFVTYSEESKIKTLNVKKETIDKYNIVSENVAIEMAMGTMKKTGAEVACSVTGYAGPLGGTVDIPVGTVCYAICIKGELNKVYSFTNYFRTERNIMREKTAMIIYYHLYRILKDL